jgi:replicative DNA helicase
MSSKELVERFLSSNARVNLKGRLFETDFPKLTSAAGRIANSTLHIIDDCQTVEEIRAEARRLKREHNIEFMGVDYIQRVHARSAKRDANREQEISYISSVLKSTAKELGIPVMAPSQLNDDGKLRESRAIGQDADGVWELERDDKQSNSEADSVALWIRKNRAGPRGVCVNLTFLKTITRFEQALKVSDEDYPRE